MVDENGEQGGGNDEELHAQSIVVSLQISIRDVQKLNFGFAFAFNTVQSKFALNFLDF